MSLTAPQRPTGRIFLAVVLGLGLAVLALYAFTALSVFRYGPVVEDAGWTAIRSGGQWRVRTVQGPAVSALRKGDIVLAIDGDQRFGRIDPALKLQALSPGQNYTVRIRRGPDQLEFPLSNTNHSRSNAVWVVSLLAAGIVFYAVGILFGAIRPGSPLTRLGCVSSLVSAMHIAALGLRSVAGVLTTPERFVFAFASSAAPWHLALGYHFFSRFPSELPESRPWIALRWLIYAYCGVVALPRLILNFVAAGGYGVAVPFHLRNAGWIEPYQENLLGLEGLLKILAAVAMCLVLARNYRLLADSPDRRRRVKWVAAAAAVGIALPAVASLWMLIGGSAAVPSTGAYPLNIVITNLASALIPVTLAYAVLKYRVLGMDVVIRRGLQYLFAKNTLRFLLLLPALALAWQFASHRDRNLNEALAEAPPYFYIVVLAAGGLSLRYHRQLSRWVDRRFFREAFDREGMLLDLIEQLKHGESIADVSATAGSRIQAALHPASVHVLCRRCDGGEIRSLFSTSESQLDLRTVTGDELADALGDSAHALQVIPGRSVRPEPAWRLLEQAGTRLIVPIRDSRHKLIGAILLGEKRSEEPFTSSDRALLQAIGTQLGTAFDLVMLRERVDIEQKSRENAIALMQNDGLRFMSECPECGLCFDGDIQQCPHDTAQLDRPLLIERIIGTKYRLDQRIGKGGYGAVYEAWDLHLKRRVALKVVAGAAITHSSAMRRFEREARAAARLNHPNIIAIYDYGPVRPEGAYLAMELIRGATWRTELRRMGSFPAPLAADWLDQLLEGISAAHQEGVVHRDLKPENVLIAFQENGNGVVKILDFGLAKLRLLDFNDTHSFTIAGSIVGTLGYMSPEQFSGDPVDERSDIFSLGIMTVEALTGKRPFQGQTPAALLKSVLHDPVQLKAEGRGGKDLNRVLQRCLAKDPAGRYRSVGEMRRDLIPLVRSSGVLTLESGEADPPRTMTLGV